MLDNLDPRDANADEHVPSDEKARQRATSAEQPTDREVPLASTHTPDAIHKWLDGESVNENQLHAAEREYDFWRRVEEEAGRRRRMKTPSSLPNEIMRAIKKDG